MNARTVAILQARTGSRRLPGKVLMPLLGQPMLLRQIERVRRCRRLDALVVATSSDPSDDALGELCAAAGVDCFRGSLDNVLDRYYQAARQFRADRIVRLTGDCPLADPEVIDAVIGHLNDGHYDFVSNAIEPTFADGLDAAVFGMRVLEDAWREATLPSDREHVTLFMRRQQQRYRIGSYRSAVDRSHLRWTVDEPADFEFVKAIYERLYPGNATFSSDDVLNLLDAEPELQGINRGIVRNAGLQRSLIENMQAVPRGAETRSTSAGAQVVTSCYTDSGSICSDMIKR